MSPIFFRNDDVTDLTPQLRQVTDLFLEEGVPLHHAVIPCRATERLVEWLRTLAEREPTRIGVDLHGWDHQTFQGAPEFGSRVPSSVQRDHLVLGRDWMRERFGSLFSGILVPPHNGYTRTTVRLLHELGFTGLSGWARDGSWLFRLAQPVLYGLNRGELWGWNGRRFPGTRIVQCSVTVDPVVDYRTHRLSPVEAVMADLERTPSAVQGIALHDWVLDGPGLAWLRTLLRQVRGRGVIRMADVVAATC